MLYCNERDVWHKNSHIQEQENMKIPSYVILKPRLFNVIPWLSNDTANAIYPFIFLPRAIYNNLQSPHPNQQYVALLIHEEIHRKRQKEIGWVIFNIKYLTSPKFRFNEELLAIKEAIKYLKKHSIPFDFEKNAQSLSGWLYFWPISKYDAKKGRW